jgi:hypothetical protein
MYFYFPYQISLYYCGKRYFEVIIVTYILSLNLTILKSETLQQKKRFETVEALFQLTFFFSRGLLLQQQQQ